VRKLVLPLIVAAGALAACQATSNPKPAANAPMPKTAAGADAPKLAYPATKTVAQVDDYHGTKVSDPYRWLEDIDSPATHEWIEAENKVTFDYLARIPGRDAIKQRLTEIWNYERYSAPQQYGGRYFYTHNDGLQNQAVLYVADAPAAKPRLLLDPNTLTADGTMALKGYAISENGKRIKRPVVVTDDAVLVGFREDAYAAAL